MTAEGEAVGAADEGRAGGKPMAFLLDDLDDFIKAVEISRWRQGVTLAELAARVGPGTDRTQVGKWLNGTHEPQARRIWQLAHGLGYGLALIPRGREPGEI